MKRVFRAASLLQVAHARNVLIAAGIQSELRNQYLAGALGDLPMLETWPQLWVEDAFETAALRALAAAASAPAGSAWTCAECGEILEPQFTSCWRCGAASQSARTAQCRTNTDSNQHYVRAEDQPLAMAEPALHRLQIILW